MASKKGGRTGIRAAIEAAETAPPVAPEATSKQETAASPVGDTPAIRTSGGRLIMRPEGLMKVTDDAAIPIAGYFEILSQTRDDDAQAWGLLIRFVDPDGAPQIVVVRRDLFAGEGGELRSLLARKGLYVNPARAVAGLLAEYLSRVGSDRRARIVGRTGWHRVDGRRIFVLPDRNFGSGSVEIIYQAATIGDGSLFNVGGTLESWRTEVGEKCAGNSRLVLAVSAAFASPLLEIFGEDGGGIHFRGASRVGKTTALRVAASVWGGDGIGGAASYIRQWRATDNGMESLALAQSDTLLPLDELGQADARTVGETAYLLASGQGKARSDRTGGLRAPMRFRVLFLSTGELSLADKIQEAGAGRRIKAGQEVRLLDIPADAGKHLGLFERLHDAPDAEAFTQQLRIATMANYGSAAPAFLEALHADLEQDRDFVDEKRDWLSSLTSTFLESAGVADEAGGQVRSVARRFALIALAGELATRADVTAWAEGEATTAAEGCFKSWLQDRGVAGAREDEQAIRQLRDFLLQHGEARFSDYRAPLPANRSMLEDGAAPGPVERFRPVGRAGWREWKRPASDLSVSEVWHYYLTPGGMHEALGGLDFGQAVTVLAERGYLDSGRDGKRSRLMMPPGHQKLRLYAVNPSILTDD